MAKPSKKSAATNSALFIGSNDGDIRTIEAKRIARAAVKAQVDEYLAGGGIIEFIESQQSVTPSMKAGFQDAARY